MKIKVKLSPHIYDEDIKQGLLQYDVCISNIDASIDSEHALCSWEHDRMAIHKAIKSQSLKGFDDINRVVEAIRLAYLLDYPIHKINCRFDYCSKTEVREREKKIVEQFIVHNIITLLGRVYSIAPNEVPNFETVETQSKSSELTEVFLEWKKLVESLIKEKKQNHQKYQDFMTYITNCCQRFDYELCLVVFGSFLILTISYFMMT